MDTIDFVKNLDSDDISSVVTSCFDELMVLYNLVGSRQDVDICTDKKSPSATFTILMDSQGDAEMLYENLNGKDFSVYGNNFNISMSLHGEHIKTIITKTLS